MIKKIRKTALVAIAIPTCFLAIVILVVCDAIAGAACSVVETLNFMID
jgi:hypothetical protein